MEATKKSTLYVLVKDCPINFTGLTAPTSDKVRSLYPEISAAIVTSPFRPKGLKVIKAGRREESKDER